MCTVFCAGSRLTGIVWARVGQVDNELFYERVSTDGDHYW